MVNTGRIGIRIVIIFGVCFCVCVCLLRLLVVVPVLVLATRSTVMVVFVFVFIFVVTVTTQRVFVGFQQNRYPPVPPLDDGANLVLVGSLSYGDALFEPLVGR